MSVVRIFLTRSDADEYEPFIHDDTDYVFSSISSDAPTEVIDGPVWVFIDWVLEDLAGLELCRRLRSKAQLAGAHITMVLDSADFEARKRALDAGADDYMAGPVDRRAVLDRIMALSPSSTHKYSAEVLEYGPLTINVMANRAFWSDTPINISHNQFRILRFMAENANRTMSRQDIVAGLGRDGEEIAERTVDVWIRRLRRAIREAGGGSPLRTVRSVGYILDL